MIRRGDGSLFAVVRRPLDEDEAQAHRRDGTDPFEGLARILMEGAGRPGVRDLPEPTNPDFLDALAAPRTDAGRGTGADRIRTGDRPTRPLAEAAADVLSRRLLSLRVASCTCMTKTPAVEAHAEDCTYRRACLAQESLDGIVAFLSDLPEDTTRQEGSAGAPVVGWIDRRDMLTMIRGEDHLTCRIHGRGVDGRDVALVAVEALEEERIRTDALARENAYLRAGAAGSAS